jgi:hypothetical protein
MERFAMGCIIRSTVIISGESVDRHFVSIGDETEVEAVESVRRSQGGDVSIVGVVSPGVTFEVMAIDYCPPRAPHA